MQRKSALIWKAMIIRMISGKKDFHVRLLIAKFKVSTYTSMKVEIIDFSWSSDSQYNLAEIWKTAEASIVARKCLAQKTV